MSLISWSVFSWHSNLVDFFRSIVNEILTECHSITLQKIDWLLEMEATATFTLNEHYFFDYRQKFLESYRSARAEENGGGEDDLRPEELVARDSFEPALQIMASVRGYFQGGSSNCFSPYQTAHCSLSFLQAVRGHGPNGHRSRVASGVGLGSWDPDHPHRWTRDNWPRWLQKIPPVPARAPGRPVSKGGYPQETRTSPLGQT